MTVRFAPIATANYTGDLFRVNYDDGTLAAPVNTDYGVEGQSDAPALLSIAPVPDPFVYPDTVHTDTLDHTWQITNGGGVTATAVTIGGLAYPFSMPGGYPGGGTCPIAGTIGAGVTCTVIVRFAPTDTATGLNAYADTLELDYQDGVGAATQVTQAISGNGIDRAILAITPNPHDYSNVAVGGLSTQTFTVTNTGDFQAQNLGDAGMTLPLNYIWTSGSYPGHARGTACGVTLDGVSGTNTCELDVSFDPQAPVDINKDGAINLVYDNGLVLGLALTADLDGTPRNPALMQVTSHGAGPFDYLFQPNGTDTDEVFTLTNNGNVPAIINTVTIVGPRAVYNKC